MPVGTSIRGWRRAARPGVAAAVALAVAACNLGAPPVVVDVKAGDYFSEAVAVGDVDGDGDVDFVVGNDWDTMEANPLPGGYSVVLSDGAGGYAVERVEAPFFAWREVELVDVDEDGALDIVGSDSGNQGLPDIPAATHVLPGDGQGGFGAPTVVHAGPGAIEVADVDGDGHLDLVVVDREVQVRLGDGTGAFGAPITSAYAALPGNEVVDAVDALLDDLDGDGAADLVVPFRTRCSPDPRACPGRAGTAVLAGDGAGGFGPGAGTPVYATPDRAQLADVDGDDDPDLVSTAANGITTYLNDGDGGFGTSGYSPLPDGELAYKAAVADVDGDGTPDAVVSGYDNHGHLLSGNGDGTFGPPTGLATSGGGASLANDVLVGDFLGDERVDVAFVSGRADKLTVLENRR